MPNDKKNETPKTDSPADSTPTSDARNKADSGPLPGSGEPDAGKGGLDENSNQAKDENANKTADSNRVNHGGGSSKPNAAKDGKDTTTGNQPAKKGTHVKSSKLEVTNVSRRGTYFVVGVKGEITIDAEEKDSKKFNNLTIGSTFDPESV